MKKLKSLSCKITKKFKALKLKMKLKKSSSKVISFIKNNDVYFFMFFSLFLLDISTRIATNSIGFVHFLSPYPNLFSFTWIFTIIFLVKYLKNIYGKLIYGLFYGFSFIMFLVQNIYYIYFKIFFDFSVLSAASEGSSYLLDTLKDIKIWMYFFLLCQNLLIELLMIRILI